MVFGELVLTDPSTGNIVSSISSSIELTGRQTGALCSFILSQKIENKNQTAVRAKYVYQTDNKYCIYKTRLLIDDTEILIKIKNRNESKEIYDEAVSKGHTAVLSKTLIDGFNEIDIGNLPPNKTCIVETYFTFLAVMLNSLTINVKIPIDLPRFNQINSFNFRLDIDPLAEISSIESNNNLQIDMNKKMIETNEFPNNMSIIFIEKLKTPMKSYILKKDEYLCLNYCLEEVKNVDYNDHEFIFVIDCSGSMDGTKIVRASECLEVFLKSLPFGCKFNIYRYGDSFQHLFNISCPYNSESAQQALDYVRNLKADLGYTKLSSALKSIYKTKSENRIMFVLTDGEDFDKENVMNMIEKEKSTRIFSIGLGNGADHGLVEFMARVTNGKSISVFSSDNLTDSVIQLLDQALKKPLPPYSIECEGCSTPEIQPHPLPMLFSDSPTQFFIKAANVNSMIVCFDGDGVDSTISDVHNVNDESIKALFSKFCIDKLEGMILNEPDNQELKEMMVNHSIESGVLCSLTAYIGVDEANKVYQPSEIENREIVLNDYECPVHHSYRPFDDDDGVLYECSESEPVSDGSTEFFKLIRLQKFDGCWTSVSQILAIFGINKEIVLEGIKDERIVSTILALAILVVYLTRVKASRHIIKKAKSWISEQIPDRDIDELIQKVLSQLN